MAFALTGPATGAFTSTTSPTFSWGASSDATSGLAKYQLYVDGALNRDNISTGATSTTPASALAEGAHTWKVVAVDNAGHSRDSSATWSLTVASSTATTLSSSPKPSTFGQSVTFTATVTSTAGTPTGTVTFKDGATNLGTGSLSSGTANFNTAALSVGAHSITAEYGGDSSFNSSTSSTLSHDVGVATTATSLSSSPNPSTFGQSVTFNATVISSGGTPTGSVAFKEGATTLGTATLSGGTATFSTAALSVGAHSITAEYGGDSSFNASTSSALSQGVGVAATTTTLASSSNPSTFSQSVTFTATVTSSGGTPTGSVAFKEGATTLGTATLSGGTATFSTAALSVGAHSITAEYGGDSSFNASTSSALSQTVNEAKASTATALASSPNPSTLGQTVAFTATVTSSGGTPTGSVTFVDGSTTLGTGALSVGVATFSTSSLAAGSHSITAAYGGDSSFNSSTSAALSQTVNEAKASTTTSLASSANPAAPGETVAFTATVTSSAGTPAGSVTFKDGSATLGTRTLSGGRATYSTSRLTLGYHSITAEYGGDSSFAASASAPLVQLVTGRQWAALGLGIGSNVYALAVNGSGNLYAGGNFTTAGGWSANRIARWNGSSWSALGSGLIVSGRAFGWVNSLAVDASGNLYAGGWFTKAGGVSAERIAKWNGSSWSALGSGMNGTVRALAFDASGVLYAGGDFTAAGGVSATRIAKWNGSSWSALGSGMNGAVWALAVDGSGNLYAGGRFTTVWGVANTSRIAKWNGASWSALGGGMNGAVYALATDGSGNLYAGGDFTTAGGVSANGIARWNGSSWSALGTGLNGVVNALALDRSGNLYAGGWFTTAGGVGANRIARWNGSSWSALGSGMNGTVAAMALDASGDLYAGGEFTTAGSVQAARVAVYGPGASTATTLASSANPSAYGQAVTFTATITATAGTATGSVTFVEGATVLGTGILAGGTATYTTSTLRTGPHAVAAWYNGASRFQPSASAKLTQTVQPAPALALQQAIRASSGPHPPQAGTATTYDLELTASNPGVTALQNVTVANTVPAGVAIVSASAGLGAAISASGQTVTWTPGALGAGAAVTATVRLSVTPTQAQEGQYLAMSQGASGSGASGGQTVTAATSAITVGPVAVPRGRLSGVVTDLVTGNALSPAAVQVYDSNNNLAAQATTGSDGAYSIANLPPGSYRVAFSKPNHLGQAVKVEVTGGQTTTADAALAPLGGSLTGMVTDAATGEAVPGATVEVRNADGSFVQTEVTNSAGRYSFGNVAAGVALTVTATHPDYDAGAGSTATAQPKWQGVSATARAYTADLLLYPKVGQVSGLVRDILTRSALAGVRVSAYDARNNLVAQASTATDGSYTLAGLQEGSYTVRFVREPDYQPTSATAVVLPNRATGLDPSLTPRPGSIAGAVYGDQDKLAGATVRLLDSLGTEMASTETGSGGEYQFQDLAPGTYTVTAAAPYHDQTSTSKAGLTLAPAGSAQATLRLKSNTGSIAGAVADAQTGAALAGAAIQVYDGQSNLVARATAGSDGAYSLARVPAGSYTILATRPNYREVSAATTVLAGQVLQVSALLPPLPGSVSGKVADSATLQALAGAGVALLDGDGVSQATGLSSDNGGYALSGVVPGSYTAAAEHPDYDTGSQGAASLTLAPGGQAERDLRLSPKASAIGGRVSSATTGQALASVRVTAYDGSNNLAGSVTTDASGVYTVTNLAQGSYTLSVDGSAAGYLPAAASVGVGPNRTLAQDLALAPRAGSLSGLLTDAATGEPIPGATVVLTYTNGATASARTNAAGEYAFTEVTAEAPITVTAEAASPFYLQGAGSTTGATAPAGGSAKANLRLHPGPGSISGSVADALTGAPLAGVTVQLYDANGNRVGEGVTDSQGGLSLERVPAGTYSLLADKANYHPGSLTKRLRGGESLQVKVLLAPRPGSIVGKVLDSASLAAMAGARVSLVDASGLIQDTTLSEATGAYAFAGVVPGSYTVAAGHGDYDTGEQGRAALVLSPGGMAERRLRLDPKPSAITGRAASATTGQAVASARVMAYDANGNLAATVSTDASGTYTVTNLAQGAFTLSVDGSAAGYLLTTVSVALKPAQSLVQNLALPPRAGSLSGTLTNAASGQPIAGAQVSLAYPDGSSASARTNAGGEYAFTEVTAQVAVTVTAMEARPYYLQTADSTATGTVPAGGASTANLRLQPGLGSVTGVAASALGPVSGATLQLYDAKNNLVAQATTGSDGSYSLSGLPPGAYTLTFSKAGWLSSSYSAKVEPGATASLDLAPTPLAGSISGTVKTSSTLRPLARAAISLEDSAGSILATTLSDATGKYAFAGVTPGAYRVTAQHSDYQTGSKGTATGVLAPDGTLSFNLSLDPRPAAITGRVASSSTGQPIPGAILRVYQANGDLLATATADATGTYTVAGIPETADPYTLEWTAPSYLPATNRLAISSGQRAVQNTALVPVEGSLSGKVTDAITGKAIQRATVEVRNNTGDILATSRTDRSGRYLVVGLPSQASLSISATALNYRTIASSLATVPFVLSSGASAGSRASDTAQLIARYRQAALSGTADLQLQPNPGSITGQASDAQTGAPLPGATVQLYDANNNLVATATTDASGAYTFSEVTVGDYTISVAGSGYLAASQAISVDPGQAGAKDVPLPPQVGSISGTLTDATTGKPLSGATVVLTDPAGLARSTTSQANGAFAFAGVSAGTSVVGASHSDYTTGNGSSSNVILLSGQAAKADLALYPRPGEVSGTILDPTSGQLVAGGTMQVRDGSGNLLGTFTTDAQGRYYVRNLPPGSYTISFSRVGYLDASSTVRVSSNQAVEASMVAVPVALSISGAVTNSSTGQAIAGARVELLDGSGNLVSTVLAGSSGRYIFASVSLGTYTLRASHLEYDSGSGASATVTLAAGQGATRDLRLDPKKGAIQVTVLDQATGQPLAGASITISNTQGLVATLSTDSQGQAAKDGLPAGVYQVTASRSGLAARSATATVEPNRKALASLRLGYLVRATVLETETNQPVVGATVLLVGSGGAQAGAGATGAGGALLLDVTATGTYTITASAPEFDQMGQSTASFSLSAGSPSVSATLYLARQKTPHLTLDMARFAPRVLPFEVRGMAAGEPIYYGISYGNFGTTRSTGVAITETLPISTTLLGPAGWTRVDARTYTYNVGILGVGERGTVQFVVARDPALAPASAITNTVTIGDDGRNGLDRRPAGAVTDVFRLHAIFLPLLQKSSAGGW